MCTQLCSALCDPMDSGLPGSSVHGISRLECWSGLPFPTPGNLVDPGIESKSLESSALAGRFFTTNAIFFTPVSPGKPHVKINGCL